jgi:hypothetical protein
LRRFISSTEGSIPPEKEGAMPRFILTVLAMLAVLVAGCTSSPRLVNLSRPTTSPAPQALDCVRTQFQRLGYRAEGSAPGATSVTGIRIHEAPWLLRLIGYRDTANQITASVSQGQLQVTAVSSDPANPMEGGLAGQGTTANRTTERHAEDIVRACT